ncbi:hypothetical protein [Luteolibacter marinus]|uniref:hypothetical protein n=1 Tax=Luteolibacter marinus TaxID=2776705 RepID=UPI001865C63B|nr:hypothetical protein [Luteolibacter marinus]
MTLRSLSRLPFLLPFLTPLSAASAPSFTRLGTTTSPTAISADGTTVAGNFNSGAFYWNASAGKVYLPQPAGATQWQALAVSADGAAIAGNSSEAPFLQTVRWDSGAVTGLGAAPGTLFPGQPFQASGNGMSADGSVIVGYSTTTNFGKEAFRWEGGTYTPLGVLAGDSSSSAEAVSADGSTVVGQSTSGLRNEAFVMKSGQAMTGIGDIAGGDFDSIARAVSADGNVVAGTGTGSSGDVAFRWTAANGMNFLPFPPDATQTRAFGISADGSIIVGEAIVNFKNTAVIWTEEGGGVNLMTLLDEKGIDFEGLLLYRSVGISADGDTITGKGYLDGNEEGWMITGVLDLLSPDVPLPEVQLTRSGATVTLGFSTVPGYLYQAERSPDLSEASWEDIGASHSTATATEAGVHEVIDAGAGDDRGYYRVRVEPAP